MRQPWWQNWKHMSVLSSWADHRAEYVILRHRSEHYCGYCTFPTRFLQESGYQGIVTYVPVHGGITFTKEHPDGSMTYGFDCGHAGDEEDPRTKDPEWLAAECHKMSYGILVARDFEDDYLRADSDAEKAAVIDAYHRRLGDVGILFNVSDNLGTMINLLFGGL